MLFNSSLKVSSQPRVTKIPSSDNKLYTFLNSKLHLSLSDILLGNPKELIIKDDFLPSGNLKSCILERTNSTFLT